LLKITTTVVYNQNESNQLAISSVNSVLLIFTSSPYKSDNYDCRIPYSSITEGSVDAIRGSSATTIFLFLSTSFCFASANYLALLMAYLLAI
jgi:hypothetical protein